MLVELLHWMGIQKQEQQPSVALPPAHHVIIMKVNGLFRSQNGHDPCDIFYAEDHLRSGGEPGTIRLDDQGDVVFGWQWVWAAQKLSSQKLFLVEVSGNFEAVQSEKAIAQRRWAIEAQARADKARQESEVIQAAEAATRRRSYELEAISRAEAMKVRLIERKLAIKQRKVNAARKYAAKFRARKIWLVVQAGATYAAVAEQMGISRERVRQIFDKFERERNGERFRATEQFSRGEIIDMGGQDGKWHTWTPEANARELGLI